jgi:thiosulfate dehydrogenase (quinone) large subunit
VPDDRSSSNARAIAALRIAVGLLFLIFGEYKVTGRTFVFGGGFTGWIHRFLEGGSAYPFMVPILQGFVLGHATALAALVAGGEVAIGLSLCLGLLVRPASLAGLIYMVTLLCSSNYPGADSPLWTYFGASLDHSVLALCFLAFLLGDPEACWSVGGRLRARTARGMSAA